MAKKMLNEAKQIAEGLDSISASQVVYEALFSKLNVTVNNLKLKYPPQYPQISSSDSDSSSSDSDECETREAPASSSGYISTEASIKWEELKTYMPNSNDMGTQLDDKNNIANEYPHRVELIGKSPVFIIGPNGTKVNAHDFEKIVWHHSAAFATRTLLSLIFSTDVLATHTLTGKPSPAFHGRERPDKMKLDKLIVDDIMHCVMGKCGSNRAREIRSAITTKCADADKKNKRRLQRKPTPTEMEM